MKDERLKLIDSIIIESDFGLCTLNIVDPLPWTDDDDHLTELQAKINNCLQYVESSEIYIAYPASRGFDMAIHVQFIYAPNEEANRFLQEAQNVLGDAGYEFSFGPLGSDYAISTAE
ncbi:DUF6572 domain-containing protein [Herminiimonas fonticola]|uniref:Uncharacterized protein n=1 Tax=Herminiimonas fonticola TaxID=303380 RepID=A0A4R6GJX7_9BURK|nr:DUF6572 domain-containing protein [Herminiimonas fonticola]RBA25491.1 hypothetical protein Hfont_1124 [Herminiimonas fonticola]TDN94604.1 hypothetical protein EV677_1155 [Herminiimonas fonticola]